MITIEVFYTKEVEGSRFSLYCEKNSLSQCAKEHEQGWSSEIFAIEH